MIALNLFAIGGFLCLCVCSIGISRQRQGDPLGLQPLVRIQTVARLKLCPTGHIGPHGMFVFQKLIGYCFSSLFPIDVIVVSLLFIRLVPVKDTICFNQSSIN